MILLIIVLFKLFFTFNYTHLINLCIAEKEEEKKEELIN